MASLELWKKLSLEIDLGTKAVYIVIETTGEEPDVSYLMDR